MVTNNKYLVAVLAAGLGLMSSAAFATDVDVDATIDTRAAIALTKNFDMDFGTVDYAATHSGTIRLSTSGVVTLVTPVGLTMSGTPVAGSVDATGDGASTIEISCETGGTLGDGTNTLTLSAVEFAIDTGVAAGSGTACAGLGTSPGTVDLGSNATPTILLGASINTTADAIDASATYTTTAGNGDPVTLRVVYQ